MDRTRKVKCRVTILNKFGVTHPSVTGRSAGELAGFLYANGFDVRVVSIKAAYKGKYAEEYAQLPYRLIELKNLYCGVNKYARLLSNLIDGFRLVAASLQGRKDDVKIVMTDPSLINMWAVLLRPFYRSRLVFWTMDLYPDAFCAAGLVCPENLLYSWLASVVYHFPPDYLIALGSLQYEYLSGRYDKNIPYTLLPCGIKAVTPPQEVPWWKREHSDKIIFCYAGNLGEAHDDRFLQELIRRMDVSKHILLLALYGSKSKNIYQCIGQRPGVFLIDYMPPEQMVFVDVTIASLLPGWSHVCVPSKVVTAICSGCPVLYNASATSDGYNMFKDAIWLVTGSDNYTPAVSDFLANLDKESIIRKKKAAIAYACRLHERYKTALEDIMKYCLDSCQ